MKSLSGIISDRLRKLLSPDDTAWTPQRDNSTPKATPPPKGVDGRSMTGRKPKK